MQPIPDPSQALAFGPKHPVARAVWLLGGRSAVAKRFGVAPESVRKWVTFGLPPERAPDFETLTGIKVETLCPDEQWMRDAEGRIARVIPSSLAG